MRISQAYKNDLDSIWKLIQDVIDNMHVQGMAFWDRYYPIKKMIIDDIKNKSHYILSEKKEIIAIMTLNENFPPEYKKVNWLTRNGKSLIVHRLAVAPKWQGKGTSHKMMDFAEKYAKENGYVSIKLDTYSLNPPGIRLYEGRGYIKTGQVFFRGYTEPFYCYEKVF